MDFTTKLLATIHRGTPKAYEVFRKGWPITYDNLRGDLITPRMDRLVGQTTSKGSWGGSATP